jgi:hypothetical protein
MNWLGNFFRGMLPNCKEAVRLQSEAMDRPLPFGRKIGLRLHLLICKWCRRYGRQIAFLRTAAHAHNVLERAQPGQALSAEAMQRIKDKLSAEGK